MKQNRKAGIARAIGGENRDNSPKPMKTGDDVAEHIRHAVMTRKCSTRSSGESIGKVTISIGVASQRPNDTAQYLH